jgi:SWIM zinc finger
MSMNLRELKALEIAARTKIGFTHGVWMVPSQSDGGSYRVTIGPEPSCSCDDFQLRKLPCKHILAARLVCARDHDGREHEGTAPEIAAAAVPKKPSYQQNWPMYNEAQQTEKSRFQKLLFDLCRGLPNLVQTAVAGAGRRWRTWCSPVA